MSNPCIKYIAVIFAVLTALLLFGVLRYFNLQSAPPHIEEEISSYRNTKPPVICRIPIIKEILVWKCRKRTDRR